MIDGVFHFGLTVSNIEEAIHFFRDYLGMELIFPVTERSGPAVEKVLGMSGARNLVCVLKTPDNVNIELHQYLSPEGVETDLRTCNVGVAHFAFTVSDVDKLYRDLAAKGVEFASAPVLLESGPLKGGKACYMRGPDGFTIELVQLAQ